MSCAQDMEAGLGLEATGGAMPLLPPAEPAPALRNACAKTRRNKKMQNALRALDVAGVKLLLAETPSLAYSDLDGVTALDLICDVSDNVKLVERIEIFQELWKVVQEESKINDILNHTDPAGFSHLYQAISSGYLEIVKVLVNAGANVEKVQENPVSSPNVTSALHIAVRHPDILKYFLDTLDIKVSEKLSISQDMLGHAPIHYAAAYNEVESMKLLLAKFGDEQINWRTGYEYTVLHVAALHGADNIAEFLLERGLCSVSSEDNDGKTPLTLSAQHGHKSVTALLLGHKAVLSEKGSDGISAVEYMAKTFDEPTKFLEDVFDRCISENKLMSEFNVGYEVLTNTNHNSLSQINVVAKLVRCGQSDLLKHPLIQSLLYLKWKCLLPVFYAILIIYAVFLLLFNTFVVTVFYKRDKYNDSICITSPNKTETSCFECFDDWSYWMWITFIYFTIFLLLIQECLHIYLQRLRYLIHLESWVKLCLLVLAAVVPITVIGCTEPAAWIRHVACAALLLSWLQAMFLMSRFPNWGYYVLMFERVAYNMFKIVLTSVCLIIGFSFCFMIEYHSKPPFDSPGTAFIKTVVMMSSEFDYEGLVGADHEIELRETRAIVRLLFVIFLIFVIILLMNFITGVAVTDTNELNVIGNIRRLEKQLELLSTFDVIGDSALLKLFPKLSCRTFHHHISKAIESNDKKWYVHVYTPVKNEEDHYPTIHTSNLTSEIQNAIIGVAMKDKDKNKIETSKNDKKKKLEAVYNAVVGIPLHLKSEVPNLQEKVRLLEMSVDDLKNNVTKILDILTNNSPTKTAARDQDQ